MLRQVASWLVPGSADIEALESPEQAGSLVALAQAERLLGPLLVAVDGGALPLPAPVVVDLVDRHKQAMLWCLHVETRLLDLAEWFDDAGVVDYRVLKGLAAAHLDEPDPSLRFLSDIDVLIPATVWDRAVAVLLEHGAWRPQPERRPGFDRRFAKGLHVVLPDRVEVDLHRTLVQRAHTFRIPLERLFADPESFVVGGREFLAMAAPQRALNIAYHAVVNGPVPPLRNLRDLAQYLARPELGPEVLVPEVERWRGLAVLARGVRAVLVGLPVSLPAWENWLDRVVVDPAEDALLTRGQRVSPWPVEWSVIRELPWPDRAEFLWAVALPSAEFRAAEPGMAKRRVAYIRSMPGRLRPGAR